MKHHVHYACYLMFISTLRGGPCYPLLEIRSFEPQRRDSKEKKGWGWLLVASLPFTDVKFFACTLSSAQPVKEVAGFYCPSWINEKAGSARLVTVGAGWSPPSSTSHGQTEMLLWDHTGVIFWFNIRGHLREAGVMVFILKGPSTPCPHLLLFSPTGTSFLLIPGRPSLLQSGPELAGSIWEASLDLSLHSWSLSHRLLPSSQAVPALGDLR